jgi:hypothetical protein
MTEPEKEPGKEVAVAREPKLGERVLMHHEHEGGWHSVTYGVWQVSIGPDSLIMLPRSLKPDEVDDFVAAVTEAKHVGLKIKAENVKLAENDQIVPWARNLITEGGVPAGATRMPLVSREAAKSTSRQPFTADQLAKARAARAQTGPQPAGSQAQTKRPRVPLPPAPPRGRQSS